MHSRRKMFLAWSLWILGVVGMVVGIIIGAIEQIGIHLQIILALFGFSIDLCVFQREVFNGATIHEIMP